jgi:hypothetical protein
VCHREIERDTSRHRDIEKERAKGVWCARERESERERQRERD